MKKAHPELSLQGGQLQTPQARGGARNAGRREPTRPLLGAQDPRDSAQQPRPQRKGLHPVRVGPDAEGNYLEGKG